MAQVRKRVFEGDNFRDIPCTFEDATVLAGARLDRRRNYIIIDGNVCELSEWTEPCSGCSCCNEYPCDCCQERGSGCHECGYTGKVRRSHWAPLAS